MTTARPLLQTLTRTRRRFLGSAATTMLAAHLGMTGSARARSTTSTKAKEILMNSSTAQSTPEGPGSVSGAPNLPAGFTDTFTSRYIDTGELRQHAVIGGDGPPLLLVHGWPQTWYQYRLIMPELAQNFEVIAVDQRGMGLSDKPQDGYDIGTQANDLVALMDALGHQRFALVGFDTGMFIAYAVAADHPERLERMAVGEANVPGVSPLPPLFVPGPLNERFWHLMFNQLPGDVNEALVRGREDIFIGAEYAAWAGTPLPAEVVNYYIDRIASDPEALRGSFELYRAIEASAAQAEERKARRLTMPVLVIGGTASVGELSLQAMKDVADDVQTVIIDGSGHWLA